MGSQGHEDPSDTTWNVGVIEIPQESGSGPGSSVSSLAEQENGLPRVSVPSLSEILPSVSLQTFDPHGQSKKKIDRRFIFNKKEITDKVEFESAMFPNWYISTSQAEQTPVFLGSTKGGQDITDFTMEILTQ